MTLAKLKCLQAVQRDCLTSGFPLRAIWSKVSRSLTCRRTGVCWAAPNSVTGKESRRRRPKLGPHFAPHTPGHRSAAFSRPSTEAHSGRVCSRGAPKSPLTNACSYAGLKLEEILDGNAAGQQSRRDSAPSTIDCAWRLWKGGRVCDFLRVRQPHPPRSIVISSRVGLVKSMCARVCECVSVCRCVCLRERVAVCVREKIL